LAPSGEKASSVTSENVSLTTVTGMLNSMQSLALNYYLHSA